ncbi:16S rRNA (cytosine(1402)-N(4))-methyltransferase RsmH [Jannaschia sp. R86511]|uniref:16S rRNA (cytosine(1402)-N(4))-methyltransferase RsmH n=1 Tax=Jannaschia sp. R86511 TaxID=3093853 RepID=UPI0036D33833
MTEVDDPDRSSEPAGLGDPVDPGGPGPGPGLVRPAGAGAAHVPVMLERCVELLLPALQQPGAVVVDGTLGLGGHTAALLAAAPEAVAVGVDRDPVALQEARRRLAGFGDRFVGVGAVHDDVDAVLAAAGVAAVDGVLLDLGVSSMQLDLDERGFSYSRDTPLDMRMGDSGPTAADVLNEYPERALVRIMRAHADEKFADRIAKAVVAARAQQPFTTSARLVELVYDAVPAAARRTGGHPAKRLFQALRIEVNDEIAGLARALPAWLERLRPGGRMVVMSYHSGEDRLVKRAFAAVSTVDVPPGLPVEPAPAPYGLLVKGAVKASEAEVEANPRAASVRLRAITRRTA